MLAITPFNETNQRLRVSLDGAGYTLSLRWSGEAWLFSAHRGDQTVALNVVVTPAARLLPAVEGQGQITCLTQDYERNASEEVGATAWADGWRLWYLTPEEVAETYG